MSQATDDRFTTDRNSQRFEDARGDSEKQLFFLPTTNGGKLETTGDHGTAVAARDEGAHVEDGGEEDVQNLGSVIAHADTRKKKTTRHEDL